MKMLEFCILCIDDFKIAKIFNKLSKFSRFFTEKRHRRQPHPHPPQRPYDVSRGQNDYNSMTRIIQSQNKNDQSKFVVLIRTINQLFRDCIIACHGIITAKSICDASLIYIYCRHVEQIYL